jgi:hypothetical protein
MAIVPTIDGLSFVARNPSRRIFEFTGEVSVTDPSTGAWTAMWASGTALNVLNEIRTPSLMLKDILDPASYPYLSLGAGSIGFGDGVTNYPDTDLTRTATGVLQINGQTVVTQNALTNYVTLDGTQTLTNKSINAGQLTGSVTAAKGGTGLTSYTAGDLLYANGTSSLGKLAAASSGNVLLSGTSPSWGKVGLATHVSGTLPVANGGTGATSLTGILKGNGTGAVTTVTAPTGDLVGTTGAQTIYHKNLLAATLGSPRLTGSTHADYIRSDEGGEFFGSVIFNNGLHANFGQAGYLGQTGSSSIGMGGGESVDLFGESITLYASVISLGNNTSDGYAASISVISGLNGNDLSIQPVGSVIIDGRFAAGANNVASGFASAAFGEGTSATTDNAAAFGFETEANGLMSMAIGDSTTAEGNASLSAGRATVAKAMNSVAFGRGNVEQGNPAQWVAEDDLMTVGNGDPDAAGGPTASNAMALHKNGKLRVANTVESKGGFRTPKMGDIEMGLFTAGPDPTTLNAGLRYSGE